MCVIIALENRDRVAGSVSIWHVGENYSDLSRDVYQFDYLRSDLLSHGILAKMFCALQKNVPTAWFIEGAVVARRRAAT